MGDEMGQVVLQDNGYFISFLRGKLCSMRMATTIWNAAYTNDLCVMLESDQYATNCIVLVLQRFKKRVRENIHANEIGRVLGKCYT